MKSVVRLTPQGKVKDVGPDMLAAHADFAAVDARVALIQELIPL